MKVSEHLIKGMTPLLMVFDMTKSIHFYCGVLGFELFQSAGLADDMGWAYLKLGEIELMLNTMYEKGDRPSTINQTRIGHHADTVLYFGCLDVKGLHQEFTTRGLKVSEPYITSYGWIAVSLEDPDGYGLCFHSPL
ncbi:MAG: VOC family protein [Cyclobacteriaceae bacterium]|nr:VOC family protein [Cyclobacteriaceae bacterium]